MLFSVQLDVELPSFVNILAKYEVSINLYIRGDQL